LTKTPDKIWTKPVPASKGNDCTLKVNISGETLTIAKKGTSLEGVDNKELMVKQYAMNGGKDELRVVLVFKSKEMVEDGI
jgi:hypothetical protein